MGNLPGHFLSLAGRGDARLPGGLRGQPLLGLLRLPQLPHHLTVQLVHLPQVHRAAGLEVRLLLHMIVISFRDLPFSCSALVFPWSLSGDK